jgi:hypothetical protein
MKANGKMEKEKRAAPGAIIGRKPVAPRFRRATGRLP